MKLDDVLNQLEELIEDSPRFPGKKLIIDSEKLAKVFDDLKLTVPDEIKQARGIVNDRTQIITEAKKHADDIVKEAEERAKAIISQEQIVKQSQEKATEILTTANNKSREMRRAAQDFVDDLMSNADEYLTASLGQIRKTRAALKTASTPKEQ